MEFRSVKIGSIIAKSALVSKCFLVEPQTPVEEIGHYRVIEIGEVPESVSDLDVLDAWKRTIDCTWMDTPDSSYPRQRYIWGEIGKDKILRERKEAAK
jgi:hypothetical protein